MSFLLGLVIMLVKLASLPPYLIRLLHGSGNRWVEWCFVNYKIFNKYEELLSLKGKSLNLKIIL